MFTHGINEKQGGVISNFIRNVSNGVPIEIIGNGESARDYIYVEDVAEAILTPLLNSDMKYNIFNIGSGYPTTILELYHHVKHAYKKFNIDIPKPKFIQTKEHNIIKLLDKSRSTKYLKFKSRTDISNGIEKIVLWMEMNRNKK